MLSSSAGAIVCNSSCRKSFLTASHFMSDGYAWFGAAYFIYDLWHMYRVHVSKVNDKILLNSAPATNHENTIQTENGNNNNRKSIATESIKMEFSYANDVIDCNRDAFASRLRSVSDRHINFIQFCLVNPVMIIHHVFLGSFGLLVIVVSPFCTFKSIHLNTVHAFVFVQLLWISTYEANLEIVFTVSFTWWRYQRRS